MDLSLKLMDFQAKGVEFLASRQRALLAWEPGVGKTPTAVRACAKVRAKRILVFCPLIATGVWRRHFRDWSGYSDIRVLDAESTVTPHSFIEGMGVRIIPYSRASTGSKVIEVASRFSDQWDAVILDEAHYLKNNSAKRSQAIYGAKFDLRGTPLEHAGRIWTLTGTPLLNGPHEFWTHLHALQPERIAFAKLGPMSYRVFVQRYCRTRVTDYGFQVVGVKNAAELADRVRGFMHRLRAKDVLLDLPPLRVSTYQLPDSMVSISSELEAAMQAAGVNDLDDESLLAAFASENIGFSTLRRLIGSAKVEGTAAMVEDMLASGVRKIIVFAHHRDVIDALEDALVKAPLVIDGQTPHKIRELRIEEFQNSTKPEVMILSIEAASEAITLTAASHVIVMEPSPVPAKNAQAIARAHRKGQTQPVLAQFVTIPGTFDELFMEILARKTGMVMQLVDPDLVKRRREPEQPEFPAFEQEPMI